jgi:hypothetical protein
VPPAPNESEQDFRLPDLRVLGRDPEVTGLRDLEPAAERVAVQRRDQRLGRILHALEERVCLPNAPSRRPAS